MPMEDPTSFIKFCVFAYIFASIDTSGGSTIRWCVKDDDQQVKCDKWIYAINNHTLSKAQGFQGSLSCVREADCAMALATDKADLASFKDTEILKKGKSLGLKPIMGASRKNTPDYFTKYYSVAVVKKGSSLTFDNLKGRAFSCHTQVMKNAGWISPIGFLISTHRLSVDKCDVYQAVANFFNGSCAPGGNDPKYNKALSGKDKLCKLCIGDNSGQNKCKKGPQERYFDHAGALKCLNDGAGDIAFVRHSALMASANVINLEILCPNNQKQSPSSFIHCNLARVPENAVLCNKGRNTSDIDRFVRFLTFSNMQFGSNSSNNFKLYDGTFFSKSTIKLSPVPSNMQSFEKYIDSAYRKDVEALETCVNSGSKQSPGLIALVIFFFYIDFYTDGR